MAKKEIIVARLPELVADRTDPLKLETAIRYVGGIIFDASQDPDGEVAGWLAEILSRPGSLEETQAREAILILFREGFLERYAEYPAWANIAQAAEFSLEPVMAPEFEISAVPDSPIFPDDTQVGAAPEANIDAVEGKLEIIGSPEAAEAIELRSSQNEPTQILRPATFSTYTADSSQSQDGGYASPRDPGFVIRPGLENAADHLEIRCSDSSRDPFEFANTISTKRARDLAAAGFIYLVCFAPQAFREEGYVEWKNPAGRAKFKDFGNRLTCDSSNAAVIGTMLELASAVNWTRVSLRGNITIDALSRAISATRNDETRWTAESINDSPAKRPRDRRSSSDQSRTVALLDQAVGRSRVRLPNEAVYASDPLPLPRPAYNRSKRSSPTFTMVVVLTIFAAIGFGATYLFSHSQLTSTLYNQPPSGSHPIHLRRLTLRLSTRLGQALSEPKAVFSKDELAGTRYMLWSAVFDDGGTQFGGQDEKIEARFYDASGLQIASSAEVRSLNPSENTVVFSAVAMMPDLTAIKSGEYKIALYAGDQMLTEQRFMITDAQAANSTPGASTKSSEVALVEARRRKPLQLAGIEFVNSTNRGSPLSEPSTTFDAAKVLFVNWKITFENRLFNLDTGQYRVDAAYIAPDGRTLGSVDDIRIVPPTARSASFSGRLGNSAGGAFLPGQYTVNFYLNGQYVAEGKFRVLAGPSPSYTHSLGSTSASTPPGGGTIDVPTLASGRIDGLAGINNIPVELRLRPQPNGFLHGEIVIHEAGYDAAPIQGFIRGNHVEFRVFYGTKTLYFDGRCSAKQLSGTFSAVPSGESGTWRASEDTGESREAPQLTTCTKLANEIPGKYSRRGFNKESLDWIEFRPDKSCELSKDGNIRPLSKCSWEMSETEPCKVTVSWEWQEPSKYENLFNQMTWEMLPSDPALLRGVYGNGAFQKEAGNDEPTNRIVTFRPELPRGSPIKGSCWTSSLATDRPGAWRCSANNSIYDPCFAESNTSALVICQDDPFKSQAISLELTKPLPAAAVTHCKDCVWALELVDGSTCTVAGTGTLIPVGGQVMRWGCSDPSCSGTSCPSVGIVGSLALGRTWKAQKVTFRWSHGSAEVLDEKFVAVRELWR